MKKEEKMPFFARFLEKEEKEFPRVKTDIKAGRFGPPAVTMKWPSDDDEEPPIWKYGA